VASIRRRKSAKRGSVRTCRERSSRSIWRSA
jgi:hypothetical protein